jgi:hypothetical protein
MLQSPIMPNQQQGVNRDQLLQMWGLIKNSNNPKQVMQTMINQNPQLKQLIDTVNSLGDPQKAFYALAQKQGVDPNSILSLLK